MSRLFSCIEGCGQSYKLEEGEPYPKSCAQCGQEVTQIGVPVQFDPEEEEKRIVDAILSEPPLSKFVKHDCGKPEWHLIPPESLAGVIEVLMHGAAKYSAYNWKKGTVWSRYYDAALRHITAWWQGEDIDPESECHHLDHAMCCLLFLRYFVMYKDSDPKFAQDDREARLEMPALQEESGHGS